MSADGRIAGLDLIRGVAVMGILLMNVQAFAMPEAAYSNPAAYGGAHGPNLAVWAAEFVLVDGRMRGLFSFLFGASLLLVVDRAEAAGRSAAGVHYRRMAWLAVFGLAHMLLLWWGDILLHYALVGAVAFLFRRYATHQLVIAGLGLILAEIWLVCGVPIAVSEAARAVATHPSAATLAAFAPWRDEFGIPASAAITADLALHRGPYAGLVANRWAQAPHLVMGTLYGVGLETLGYMLLGMAALRSGLVAGAWSGAAYRRWALIGFGAALPFYALLAWWQWSRGFDAPSVAWTQLVLTAPLRPAAIVGWACLILLAAARAPRLVDRVAAAGRMAFSNYLGTSLVCSTFFYGYGLGWYGSLSRAEALAVVAAIWAAMLAWSRPWLTRYRYGPLEWLWRSLARGATQPMRRPMVGQNDLEIVRP